MMQPKIKYPYETMKRWGFNRKVDIQDQARPGYVYLRRWILFKTPWFATYIHFIYTPDSDKFPHNHPTSFISMILRGGYSEQRRKEGNRFSYENYESRKRTPLTVAKTTRDWFHKITYLYSTPTVTLMLVGPRKSSWGFLTDDGYVDHMDYGNN